MVASVEAFIDAAPADPDATGIQVGFYQLKKEMPRPTRSTILVDPEQHRHGPGHDPRGPAGRRHRRRCSRRTPTSPQRSSRRRSTTPSSWACPTYAEGNPEGYLFPSTYDFGPNATPDRHAAGHGRPLGAGGRRRRPRGGGRASWATRPHELMTVASLVEAEGRGEDMRQGRPGHLQPAREPGHGGHDRPAPDRRDRQLRRTATSSGLGPRPRSGEIDSPYNTYQAPGCRPGRSSRRATPRSQAAANPADGDWFYFVTVDLETGETKFAETLRRVPDQNVQELNEYCETSEAC